MEDKPIEGILMELEYVDNINGGRTQQQQITLNVEFTRTLEAGPPEHRLKQKGTLESC